MKNAVRMLALAAVLAALCMGASAKQKPSAKITTPPEAPALNFTIPSADGKKAEFVLKPGETGGTALEVRHWNGSEFKGWSGHEKGRCIIFNSSTGKVAAVTAHMKQSPEFSMHDEDSLLSLPASMIMEIIGDAVLGKKGIKVSSETGETKVTSGEKGAEITFGEPRFLFLVIL